MLTPSNNHLGNNAPQRKGFVDDGGAPPLIYYDGCVAVILRVGDKNVACHLRESLNPSKVVA
jgi:hypothetical protein